MHAPHWVDVDAILDVSVLPALGGTGNLQQLPSLTHQYPRRPLLVFPTGRAQGFIQSLLASVLPNLPFKLMQRLKET